jgi:hypothetical protein
MGRNRRTRQKAIGTRTQILINPRSNVNCPSDFVYDLFAYDRQFRILTAIDDGPQQR